MKEQIYTIPVNDAYKSEAACPLCHLRADIEKRTIDFYLGASLMESDTRAATNKRGFCHAHLHKMYAAEINRLGMGLMLHTHMITLREDISARIEKAGPDRRGLVKGRDSDYKKRLTDLAEAINTRTDECIVCDKIAFTMERYMDVLFWMYFEDEDFKAAFSSKKDHCLPHVAMLLNGAAKHLSQNKAAEFVPDFLSSFSQGYDAMVEDIHWFTLKFDYKNKEKPWGNSKDAVPRTMDLLSGAKGDGDGKR